MGAARQKSLRTNDVAGDGTATAILLAQAIVREGLRNRAGDPMILRRAFRPPLTRPWPPQANPASP